MAKKENQEIEAIVPEVMEHIKVTDLGNGFYKLVPEAGYRLKLKDVDNVFYSEAVTKTLNKFIAVML